MHSPPSFSQTFNVIFSQANYFGLFFFFKVAEVEQSTDKSGDLFLMQRELQMKQFSFHAEFILMLLTKTTLTLTAAPFTSDLGFFFKGSSCSHLAQVDPQHTELYLKQQGHYGLQYKNTTPLQKGQLFVLNHTNIQEKTNKNHFCFFQEIFNRRLKYIENCLFARTGDCQKSKMNDVFLSCQL